MTNIVYAVFAVTLLLASSSAKATPSREDPVTVSPHWAGYVARVGGAIAHVSGTWVQPRIVCNRPSSSAAFWVGLGGASAASEALEQIGTSADCSASARASYSAWYELFPARAVEIPLSVRGGDVMSAAVGVVGHVVTLRLRNTSTGESFSSVHLVPEPETDSAEWIVEAPSVCFATCATMPLAQFDRVRFTGASATSSEGRRSAGVTWSWQRFELRGRSACALPLARSVEKSASAFDVVRLVQTTSNKAKRQCDQRPNPNPRS